MKLLDKIINTFTRIERVYEFRTVVVDISEIFKVESFNNWWNMPYSNKKTPNVYAHPGIFLRMDKLSNNHFDHYLIYMGINESDISIFNNKFAEQYTLFKQKVKENWIKQS